MRETAKKLGLGESLDIQLNRETKTSGRTERISIGTDGQLALELPSIVSGTDRLDVIVYPFTTSFAKSAPTIVIHVKARKMVHSLDRLAACRARRR